MERYRDLNIKILLTFIMGFNSTGLVCVAEAPKYKLECLNDYVVTISCVMNISKDPLHGDSYWLEIEGGDKIKKFECTLVHQMDHYCCTFKSTERFIDTEYFVIAFCSNKNADKLCQNMDERYMPVHHIKPNAPINFKVDWSSGHYRFIWDSGYESYIPTTFMKRLKYRLQIHKIGHPGRAQTIHLPDKTQIIDGINFEPGTEYIAKVCSSPNQVFYKGQWSEWSTAVKWRTNVSQVATPSANEVLLYIGTFSFLACLLVGMLVFLCFHPIARCRIKSHCSVPTPAPYFQPLFCRFNGDFQSWLLSQGSLGETFTKEETLKIETLIEETPIVNEEPFLPLQSFNSYINVCGTAKQDKLNPLPPSSIQKSNFEVFYSLSLEQIGTRCKDLTTSQASKWPHGAVSSPEPQSVSCSEDYCTLTDTHNDLGHRKLSQ